MCLLIGEAEREQAEESGRCGRVTGTGTYLFLKWWVVRVVQRSGLVYDVERFPGIGMKMQMHSRYSGDAFTLWSIKGEF